MGSATTTILIAPGLVSTFKRQLKGASAPGTLDGSMPFDYTERVDFSAATGAGEGYRAFYEESKAAWQAEGIPFWQNDQAMTLARRVQRIMGSYTISADELESLLRALGGSWLLRYDAGFDHLVFRTT